MASEPYDTDIAARNIRRTLAGMMVSVSQLEETMQRTTDPRSADEAIEMAQAMKDVAYGLYGAIGDLYMHLKYGDATIPTADSLEEDSEVG